MTERIRKASTLLDLDRLDILLTRLYNNGIFTPSEYSRLDLKIVDKRIDNTITSKESK